MKKEEKPKTIDERMEEVVARSEALNERIKKQLKKANKYYAKQQAKFLKTINFGKYDTIETLNLKTLEFAKQAQDTNELCQIVLLDEQKTNPAFMLEFFKSNKDLISLYSGRLDEKLENNIDFMIDYFKLKYDLWKEQDANGQRFKPRTLKDVVSGHHILKNAQFIERLSDEFTEDNILEILEDYYFWYPMGRSADIGTGFLKLPQKVLEQQTERFGVDALKLISSRHEEYNKFIELAIAKSGFEALKYLRRDEILANKKLIVKAYNATGKNKKALRKFIEETCSPKREESYMCHGELHFSSYYDGTYKKIQKELKRSPVIKPLLEEKPVEQPKKDDSATK